MFGNAASRFTSAALMLSAILTSTAAAQTEQGPQPLSIDQAVDTALRNYPAAMAALEHVEAARATVSVAKTSYLPKTDLLWQSNLATHNNITGLLLPQSVVPPISGPVLPTTSAKGVWGSAGAALFSWEPFDFGARAASVGAARRAQDTAASQLSLTRLDVATAAADAFLALVVTQRTRQAAEADVHRRQVFANVVHALVAAQLRPGADASRADAELAAARNQLIQTQRAEDDARIALAQALGIAGADVRIQPGDLAALLPPASVPPSKIAEHPSARAARSAIAEVRAREEVLDRSYFPHFSFQAAYSIRDSGTEELQAVRNNWALGMTVSLPLLDAFSLRYRKEVEAANERSVVAQYDQIAQDLAARLEHAHAALEAARRIAVNTAVELRSAQFTNLRAEARYRAGLTTMLDVADAQRLLAQAESDDAIARLSVWRSLLAVSFAQGDLGPFLEMVQKR
jgi:outer membrane protein TolC